MKNFKGTQGKWSIDKRAKLRVVIDKDITVASASAGQCGDNLDEELSNAKLIASALEMLEALLDLENDNNSIPKPIWDKVQNVIKKALG